MREGKSLLDKIYRVLEYQDGPYPNTPRRVLVGYGDTDDSRLELRIPDCPQDPKDYINWEKPVEDQVWEREKVPECWTDDYLVKVAEELHGGDYEWWRNVEKLSEEQIDFMERRWKHREEGVWILINGQATWLTKDHVFYLENYELDNGYPNYRDRDRRSYYAKTHVKWDYHCYGLLKIKHRREGATHQECSDILEHSTRVQRALFIIRSVDHKDAMDIFNNKFMPALEGLPPFFRPMIKASSKEEIVFDNPIKGRKKWAGLGKAGLMTTVKTVATGREDDKPFEDGKKVTQELRDESGKKQTDNILTWLEVIKPSLDSDGRPNKLFMPSTVEEEEGKEDSDQASTQRIETLYWQSDPATAKGEGRFGKTLSGLKHYFTPAWDGLNMQWVGKYGESIIDKPTPEQMKWLEERDPESFHGMKAYYEHGGSYAYLKSEYASALEKGPDALVNYKRKFPETPQDSFRARADKTFLNIQHIDDTLDALKEDYNGKISYAEHLTVRGNLEWIDNIFKGDVRFVPDRNGRFIISRAYMPGAGNNDKGIEANLVFRSQARDGINEIHGVVRPYPDTSFVIGMDPFAIDKKHASSKHGLSKAGMHGFMRFDPTIDGAWEETEEGIVNARHFYSHSFVFEYYARPNTTEKCNEDSLKACIFFGARILPERNRGNVVKYFQENGCGSFVMSLEPTKVVRGRPSTVVPGILANEENEEFGAEKVRRFVLYFAYPEKCPFIRTWEQWRKMNLANLTPFDLTVSSMWTLVAASPRIGSKMRKNADIASKQETNPLADYDLY
jgi:hypothetical protein